MVPQEPVNVDPMQVIAELQDMIGNFARDLAVATAVRVQLQRENSELKAEVSQLQLRGADGDT